MTRDDEAVEVLEGRRVWNVWRLGVALWDERGPKSLFLHNTKDDTESNLDEAETILNIIVL